MCVGVLKCVGAHRGRINATKRCAAVCDVSMSTEQNKIDVTSCRKTSETIVMESKIYGLRFMVKSIEDFSARVEFDGQTNLSLAASIHPRAREGEGGGGCNHRPEFGRRLKTECMLCKVQHGRRCSSWRKLKGPHELQKKGHEHTQFEISSINQIIINTFGSLRVYLILLA